MSFFTPTTSSSPPIPSSLSVSSQRCTCYPHLHVIGTSGPRRLVFVWRGERLPTSTVLTLKNPCCVPLNVRVRKFKNGARVGVRPNIFTIQPHSVEEVLFVQSGISFKTTATVIDPPENSTTLPSEQSSRIL